MSNVSSRNGVNGSKLLIAEEDGASRHSLYLELLHRGFSVDIISPVSITDKILAVRPDVAIISLLCQEGLAAGERLANQSIGAWLLAIGADNTLAEKIETLERGFDDYFPRGFSKDDIVAKIKALLRRSPQFAKDSILEYYDLRMDRINRMVWRASDEVELRAKEFDLLKVFLLYPEEVLSRGFIFDQVWGSSFLGDSNVIEVYIRYLRSKLGKPNLIRTKRGSGYLLISEEGQIRQASQDLET